MSHPLSRDPFHGPIITAIAITTALTNRKAKEAGLQFTDSQVNAVYHRVMRMLEGKTPKPKAATSEKERLQNKLYDELVDLSRSITITNNQTGEKNILSPAVFLKAMRAAKHAVEQLRQGEPGERRYLEDAAAALQHMEALQQADEISKLAEESEDPSAPAS